MNLIDQINREQTKKLGKDIPDFAPGDTLRIGYKVSEGTRSRVQNYEGVVISRKGGIGISASFLDPIQIRDKSVPEEITSGLVIQNIYPNSAAERYGLEKDDIIISMGGYSLRAQHDISYVLHHFFTPDENISIELVRNGEIMNIELVLGTRPIN